jgi:recombination protein RecA
VVEKAGAFYKYGDSTIGQGREAAKQYLKDNPKILTEIDKKVRALSKKEEE